MAGVWWKGKLRVLQSLQRTQKEKMTCHMVIQTSIEDSLIGFSNASCIWIYWWVPELWTKCVDGSLIWSDPFSKGTNTGFIQNNATIFRGLFKDFSRTTLDFQGPPTRNIILQIVQKCTFPVYSKRTLRLELFASPTSLHFSIHLS